MVGGNHELDRGIFRYAEGDEAHSQLMPTYYITIPLSKFLAIRMPHFGHFNTAKIIIDLVLN